MKNREFYSILDVKYTAYLFEKILRRSLQYSLETKRTHSTSCYSERLYKLTPPGLDRKLEFCMFNSKCLLNLEAKVKFKQGTWIDDRMFYTNSPPPKKKKSTPTLFISPFWPYFMSAAAL